MDEEQVTTHDTRRIIRQAPQNDEDSRSISDERFLIQVKTNGGIWRDSVEFTMETFYPIDIEVAHWFTSTCPLSRFTFSLIIARAGSSKDDGQGSRVYINEGKLVVVNKDGTCITKETISSQHELATILFQYFGLSLDEGSLDFSWCL